MHNENWDDLRYALAVAEAGTVSGAARVLGVNHATVVRRIAALEARLRTPLFEKTPQGYRLPEDRRGLKEALREVETAMLAVTRLAGRQGGEDQVRVTSTDTLSMALLPPILKRLADERPGMRIRLLCSNQHLDLARMDADVAVRPAVQLGEGLTGEVAGALTFGVFRAPKGGRKWLGMTGALSPSRPARWLAEAVPEAELAGASDSFLVLRELAAAGQGQAVLPHVIVGDDPRLQEARAEMPQISVPIWVASHSDLAEVPRLKQLRKRLADEIAAALA